MQSLVRHAAASRELQRGVIGTLHRSFLIGTACGHASGSRSLYAIASSSRSQHLSRQLSTAPDTSSTATTSSPPPSSAPSNSSASSPPPSTSSSSNGATAQDDGSKKQRLTKAAKRELKKEAKERYKAEARERKKQEAEEAKREAKREDKKEERKEDDEKKAKYEAKQEAKKDATEKQERPAEAAADRATESAKSNGSLHGQFQPFKPGKWEKKDRPYDASSWKGKDRERSEPPWWKGKDRSDPPPWKTKEKSEPWWKAKERSESEASSHSKTSAGAPLPAIDKVARLAALTARVEAARADQPDLAFHPGLAGPSAFDTVPLVFPPKSVYPPAHPVLVNRDLQTTAIALGVNRWASPVTWSEDLRTKEIRLKSTALLVDKPEEEGREWIFADERNLEWVGDAVISLVMRTQLETAYPDLSVAGKTISVGRLVANDLLGHLWDESGLEAERLRVAQMLLEDEVAKAKAEALKQGIRADQWPVNHGITLRVEEITRHGSKADHFESYVGACFWILGWQETERWVKALAEPYIERIARVENGAFLDSYLNKAGEVSKRIQERKQLELKRQEEEDARSRVEQMGPMRRRARALLRPLASFFFPEVKDGDEAGKGKGV